MNPFIRLLAIPDEVERIKAAIIDMIDNMPDNPQITRLNKNCYTINSKDLGNNWNPFYHNFKSQAQFIQEMIEEMRAETIIPTLKQIARNQSINYKSKWYKFHPMFCNHLRSLIETYGVK
jgi:hypothetical protein